MLICQKVFLQQLNFVAKPEGDNNEAIELPVNIQVDYAENKEDKKKAKLDFKIEIGDKKHNKPFTFGANMTGIFKMDEQEENINMEQCVTTEGAEILLSFARTLLYDSVNKAGLDEVVLPIIHFDHKGD